MPTRRVLNFRFLLILLVTLGILGTTIHFVHGYQLKRNAEILLEHAKLLEADGKGQEAIPFYRQYIGLREGTEKDEGKERLVILLDEEGKRLDEEGKRLDEEGKRLDEEGKRLEGRNKRQHAKRLHHQAFLILEDLLRRKPDCPERRRQVDLAIEEHDLTTAKDHIGWLLGPNGKVDKQERANLRELLAQCYEAEKKYDDAIEWYEKTLADAPEKLLVSHSLSEILTRTGYVLADAPEELLVSLHLALLLRVNKDEPGKADAVMDNLVKDPKNAQSFQAFLIRAQYWIRVRPKETGLKQENYLKRAAEDVETAWKLAPNEAAVGLVDAEIRRARKDLDGARKILEEGIKKHPDNIPMLRDLVQLVAGHEGPDGGPDAALKLILKGLEKEPNNVDLLLAKADLLLQKAEVKALKIRAQSDNDLERLLQEEKEEAEKAIDKLNQQRPGTPQVIYLKARLHILRSEWTEAQTMLEDVLPRLSENRYLQVQASLLLGQCHDQLGNPDQALKAYQGAVARDPANVPARWGLGRAFMNLNRLDDALAEFRQIQKFPNPPQGLRTYIARTLLLRTLQLPQKKRNWTEVKQELDRAILESPRNPEVQLLQLEVKIQEEPKQIEQVRVQLANLCRTQPKDLDFWIALSDLAVRQNQPAEALRVLDEAAKQPQLAKRVELALARIRLLSRSKPEEARPQLANLEKLAGEKTAPKGDQPPAFVLPQADRFRLLDGLAGAFFALGDRAEARRLWQDLAGQQPHNLALCLILLDFALDQSDEQAITQLLKEAKEIEGEKGGVFWRLRPGRLAGNPGQGRRYDLPHRERKTGTSTGPAVIDRGGPAPAQLGSYPGPGRRYRRARGQPGGGDRSLQKSFRPGRSPAHRHSPPGAALAGRPKPPGRSPERHPQAAGPGKNLAGFWPEQDRLYPDPSSGSVPGSRDPQQVHEARLEGLPRSPVAGPNIMGGQQAQGSTGSLDARQRVGGKRPGNLVGPGFLPCPDGEQGGSGGHDRPGPTEVTS